MRLALRSFLVGEEGSISALSLQMFVGALVVGGLAVDFGKGVASKTQLQIAADAAAHAAIMARESHTAEEATVAALQVAALNMPAGKYGNVLSADDIRFGHWNRDTQVFTVDPASSEAVMVSTQRVTANGNGVATPMMGLVGRDKLDVTAGTVFESYVPDCFREGFVAMDRVDMQSNSSYASGFCIHSQDHVSISSGNNFAPGVTVSMPDRRDVELPSAGYSSNTGLAAALRDASYHLKILARIGDIIRGIQTAPGDPDIGIMATTSRYYRSYVTDATLVSLDATGMTALDPADFQTGRIHVLTCGGDNRYKQIGAAFALKDMVLVTDCRLQIDAGAVIENAVILSTNADDQAIYASSYIVIGKDDHCAAGGGAQIVTLGGVDFASGAHLFGSQIIAAKDIVLTAGARGIEGAALVAGGTLAVTSTGAVGYCGGNGMESNYEAAYFRLAY